MQLIKLIWVAVLLLFSACLLGCADKEAAGILYIKAFDYYKQKDLVNAEAFINQSIKCDKKNKQAIFLKAKIKLFEGQYKEAFKYFSDLYKSESDNKNLQRYLIQSLILLEDYQEAKKIILKAMDKDNGDWRLYYFSSVIAAKEKNLEVQLEKLNQAQSILREGAQVYFDLAFCWDSLGLDVKAAEYKKKCIELDSNYLNFFKEEKK